MSNAKETAASAFTKMVLRDHRAEYEVYRSRIMDRPGAHLIFVKKYKNAHLQEWEAFKTQWEADHPMECEDEYVIRLLDHLCKICFDSSLKEEWNEYTSDSEDWPLFKEYIYDRIREMQDDEEDEEDDQSQSMPDEDPMIILVDE